MNHHIVRFDIWCSKCKHKEADEKEDPCDSCLDEPFNEDSKKPTMFVEKDSHG